jgi:hypothetical protein
VDRLLDVPILLGLLGGGVIASALGFAVGLTYQPATAVKRAGEAFLLAVLGGFLAHAFISALLDLGDDSTGAGLLVGWGFFGVPGLVDSVAFVFGADDPILTRPDRLLGLAAIVGCVTGGLHGAYRIYDWRRWGVVQFVLDVTWGLLGSTLGALVHLYNCFFGTRLLARTADEGPMGQRLGVVLFSKGLSTGGRRFALTQGSVISNIGEDVSGPLLEHEKTHVFQNRVFGPFFTLTYLAWMVIMLGPALVLDLVDRKDGEDSRVRGWCYYANPWEVWGYGVHGHALGREIRTGMSTRTWRTGVVLAVAVPFYALVALGAVALTSGTLLS